MASPAHHIATLILSGKHPADAAKPADDAGGSDDGLTQAAQELIEALDQKDADAVASALKNAFMILESQPHSEGENEEE
jgi:hypothetical protein